MDKLYVVVIGEPRRNQRYITVCPFIKTDLPFSEYPLAVYSKCSRARKARKLILRVVGHKSVHVIRYTATAENE